MGGGGGNRYSTRIQPGPKPPLSPIAKPPSGPAVVQPNKVSNTAFQVESDYAVASLYTGNTSPRQSLIASTNFRGSENSTPNPHLPIPVFEGFGELNPDHYGRERFLQPGMSAIVKKAIGSITSHENSQKDVAIANTLHQGNAVLPTPQVHNVISQEQRVVGAQCQKLPLFSKANPNQNIRDDIVMKNMQDNDIQG
uniref:Uncharacterized protein n=1 Tax=Oryza rufipogon TaxID=4529 RepID=A0A0E0RD25_ORYRU